MIVMGLNLGICREEEKQAKKEVIIGYLTTHLKVRFAAQDLFKYNFIICRLKKRKKNINLFIVNRSCISALQICNDISGLEKPQMHDR